MLQLHAGENVGSDALAICSHGFGRFPPILGSWLKFSHDLPGLLGPVSGKGEERAADASGSRGVEQGQSITQPDHTGNGGLNVPTDKRLEQTEGQLSGLQRAVDEQRKEPTLRRSE